MNKHNACCKTCINKQITVKEEDLDSVANQLTEEAENWGGCEKPVRLYIFRTF